MISRIRRLQDIIGTDVGDRGMRSLIVPDDLVRASDLFARMASTSTSNPATSRTILVLSGFPCCVSQTPPTETDGPPGACAICRAALALGCSRVALVTDECNATVFAAATEPLQHDSRFSLEIFPPFLSGTDEKRMEDLARGCGLVIACERAGPAGDGRCYTMRGIDMTAMGLIAPIHRLVDLARQFNQAPFVAIGDGGNELGMGKVYEHVIDNPKIVQGDKIGCVVAADHLIAASVSNWGGYALATGAALYRNDQDDDGSPQDWVDRCLPSEQEEIDLLDRCVAVGCRDGVSGLVEATVDGLPLETSLTCLRDIRSAALESQRVQN